jgi:hypothetical protein
MMLRRLAPAAIAAVALGLAPAALANTTATGYGPPGNHQQKHVSKPKVLGVTSTGGPTCTNSSPGTSGCGPSAPATVTPASTSGSLPFTGFDLILVLATGGGLLAAGFGLRRLTRRESAS